MKTINPDPRLMPQILQHLPQDKPIIMLNLLRFRSQANYEDSSITISGREAYGQYSKLAFGFVKEVGGSARYLGKIQGHLIAPDDERWDEVMLIEYPDAGAFIKMVTNPEYQAITYHRTAALDDSRLIATTAH